MKKLHKLLIAVSMVLVLAVIPTGSASISRYWPVFTNANFSNGCQGWNLSSTAPPSSATCTNSYSQWDTSTQVQLSETSWLGPALVWNPSTAKMFMAWFGSDSIGQLNVIQSTDMVNWNNKVHWAAPGTCCDWSNNQVGLDLTYNSDNQKIYLVYLIDEITNLCPTCTHSYQIWVQSSSDGMTWSSPAQVATESLDGQSGKTGPFYPSLTYDSTRHQFELAVYNFDTNLDVYTYTSSDGISWSSPQVLFYNNSPLRATTIGYLRYLNGNYYLTYEISNTQYLLKSSDGNTWTSSVTISTGYYSGIIAYDSLEGLYHVIWGGTYESTSQDAISWSAPASLSFGGWSALAYNTNSQLLLSGFRTDSGCCSAPYLNVIQYHVFTTGTTSFQSHVSCNGCGYAGSFAQQSGSAPFSSNSLHDSCYSYDQYGNCTGFIRNGYSYSFTVGFSLTQFAQLGPSGSWFNYGLSLYVSWGGPVGPCGFSTLQLILDLKDNGGVNIHNCDNNRHLYFVEVAIDESNGSPTLAAHSYDVTMKVYDALSNWGLPDGSITGGWVGSQTNGYQLTVVYGQAQLGVNFTNACFGSGCSPQACRPNPCPTIITDTKTSK